ncbi:MAG: hypothetical protein HY980_02745 [Candidatus Magasanikbacteria bacterium]|nr:hypothetical protein [Candidatus Magasanikbacteria bacterium]
MDRTIAVEEVIRVVGRIEKNESRDESRVSDVLALYEYANRSRLTPTAQGYILGTIQYHERRYRMKRCSSCDM